MASSSSSSSPEISAAEPVVDAHSRFSYKDATQEEVLEDLSSRFILNLPDEELNSLERVCFQVEQAHWFYEDFIREENHKLSSMSLKKFSEMLFHACPLLHQWSHDHEEAFKNFMQYKTRVPVCGAIMLNSSMDKCVLVKGWKASSNWGFPKGKINETEPSSACAIREVLEETGYNIANQIDPSHFVELSIKEQKITLFFVPGVPEDFNFQTRTRKEISQIAWFKLSDLPTWRRNKVQVPNKKFYLISPFIGPLKNFINERRARTGKKNSRQMNGNEIITSRPHVNGSVTSTPGRHPEMASNGPTSTEGELGPELSRLFSSLTATSNRSPPSGQKGAIEPIVESTSTSEGQSDSSADSPIANRPQPSVAPNVGSYQRQLTSTTSPPPGKGAQQPPMKSPSLALASPASPRRSSATADISPYLSRRAEMPVSAKTLQHLQLLESIADESARMAPGLTAKAATARAQSPFTSPASGPPQLGSYDPGAYPLMHPGLSSSAAGFHAHPLSGLPYNYQDPMQMRSRTSQAFHRPPMHAPTGSMSMNQNNLLAVINGARGGPLPPTYNMNLPFPPQQVPQYPSVGYPPLRQPPMFPMTGPPHPSDFGLIPGILPPGPLPRFDPQDALHGLLGQLPGPPSAPYNGYAPSFPEGVAPAPRNPLLSILNGGSMQPSGPSTLP